MQGSPVRYIILSCLALAPLSAFASTPNFKYDYLDVGHLTLMPQTDGNGSTPFADVSYTFLDAMQFTAAYDRPSYGSGTQDKIYSLGVSAEEGLDDRTDVYTDILYLNRRYQTPKATGTEDGYRLEVGVRRRAWERIEVDGYLAHNYVTQASNEAGVGLLVDATAWLAFGVGYSHDTQYINTTRFKVRFYF